MAVFKILLILVLIDKELRGDAASTASFPIGGIFNYENLEFSRVAFKNAGMTGKTNTYFGRMIHPSVNDSYSIAMEVCQNTSDNQGITALIDVRPTNGICDNTCLICNRLNISHLSLDWQPTDTLSEDLFTFSYHPPPELISKAYATLIKDLEWDKFTILYEDDGSFIRLQEIINSWPSTNAPILFRQLKPYGGNRETFKHVFKVARMTYHVLDCNINNIVNYFQEMTQIENSTEYQSFILTSMDAHTVNLNEVPNFRANVSTMHLTTPKDARWNDIGIDSESHGIKVETALTVDALTHLEKSIRSMQAKGDAEDGYIKQQTFEDPPALCFKKFKRDYEAVAWNSGNNLREALIKTTAKGFTGKIEFDEEGKRTNFQLHYSKLTSAGFQYAGYWDSKRDTIVQEEKVPDLSTTRRDGIIKVASKEILPYFQTYVDGNGTVVHRGYAVDLVNAIFNHINENGTQFEPRFVIIDNKFGSPVPGTTKWDGMIGQLMEHNVDMAIGDISITSERNSVVDFSTPFMTTGISMLFREPEPEEPDMFSFIKPLSLDVWLYLVTTYIIVSFVLLICARMSQDDWVNPHPCNQNPENLQNIWSLYNCLWLTMGTIMTQGCDILPRGVGSRWVAGMWWFFAMIITASYTANMSTFLSNSRRSNDIKNVKELSEQNKITYGAVLNSSTYKFFEASNDTTFQKIWSVMSTTKPTVFTIDNEEGKNRVNRSKGSYAFFMESTAIEYYTERNCELRIVGSELDSKEYGIAMPKNFPEKGLVDNAILSLQESGKLLALKNKWWKEEDNKDKCQKEGENDDSGTGLQMKNTGGIFLVLGVGGILGFIVAIIDFMLYVRQISVKEKVTFKEALASEWRASLNPRLLHKPAAPPRSAPPSESPSPHRERSRSRAVSVLKAATSFINFDEIY